MDSIGYQKKTGLALREDCEGGLACKIVCDRLYGSDRAVCWLPRRRVIRYYTACAKARDE